MTLLPLANRSKVLLSALAAVVAVALLWTKVGTVESRAFALLKTAVGTIDFNENMLVQVFSQYPGKILKAFYNLGDEVKQGDILFTIDSPDLLQAESNLLASAGVLELHKRTLARVTGLLKTGGNAQKDVDQSTSDEQTA